MRNLLIAAGILLVVALTVYSLVDAIITDNRRIRVLPKAVWVIIIVLLPVVGPLLWLTVGKIKQQPGLSRRGGPIAPDDDPAFLNRLAKEMNDEERLRKLEEELKKLDEEGDGDFDKPKQ